MTLSQDFHFGMLSHSSIHPTLVHNRNFALQTRARHLADRLDGRVMLRLEHSGDQSQVNILNLSIDDETALKMPRADQDARLAPEQGDKAYQRAHRERSSDPRMAPKRPWQFT